MRHDSLELTFLAGNVRQVNVKRGSLSLGNGFVSYILHDQPEGGRFYVATHRLDSWRYQDHSRANQ